MFNLAIDSKLGAATSCGCGSTTYWPAGEFAIERP
jgi:hypothetical protein